VQKGPHKGKWDQHWLERQGDVGGKSSGRSRVTLPVRLGKEKREQAGRLMVGEMSKKKNEGALIFDRGGSRRAKSLQIQRGIHAIPLHQKAD